jgi:hypothetical protein
MNKNVQVVSLLLLSIKKQRPARNSDIQLNPLGVLLHPTFTIYLCPTCEVRSQFIKKYTSQYNVQIKNIHQPNPLSYVFIKQRLIHPTFSFFIVLWSCISFASPFIYWCRRTFFQFMVCYSCRRSRLLSKRLLTPERCSTLTGEV